MIEGASARTFASLVDRRVVVRRGDVHVGVEHEYSVWSGDAWLDARPLFDKISGGWSRLHPTESRCFLLPSGVQVHADGYVAEAISPPVLVSDGAAERIMAWTSLGRRELIAALPGGLELRGESTHLSVSIDPEIADAVALLYAQTFAPGLMLLMGRRSSPGVIVRPRPGRLELCGEFVDGPFLGTAALYAVATVAACVAATTGAIDTLPPPLEAMLEPARLRFGWYVDRRAFGRDLYTGFRATRVRALSGDTITAGEHLRASWMVARPFLVGRVSTREIERVDRVVDGAMPLPSETPTAPTPPTGTDPFAESRADVGGSPYVGLVRARARGDIDVRPTTGTWDFTVFRAARGPDAVLLSVPAEKLDGFLTVLDTGELDGVVDRMLRESGHGRELRSWEQTRVLGAFDAIAADAVLVPTDFMGVGDGEIEPVRTQGRLLAMSGDAQAPVPGPAPETVAPNGPTLAVAVALAVAQGSVKGTTPYPPPPPPPGASGVPWWIWPVSGLVIATLIAVSVISGGGEDPSAVSPSASPSVSISTSAPPIPCDEPLAAIARDVALDCPVTEHTDATDDGTWYEAAVPADPLPPGADIVGVQASMARVSSTVVGRYFGTQNACGRKGTRVVACGRKPFRAGRALVVAVRMAGPVPLKGEHFRTISVMLDGSPPSGGFRGSVGADQDPYLGTDTTIDLVYFPIGVRAKTWNMAGSNPLKSGTDDDTRSTGARAVIDGDTILFFFPGGEFRNALPRLRVLSTVSDISFVPQHGFASADVAPGRPADEPSSMFTPDAARQPASKPTPTPTPTPTVSAVPETPERFLDLLGAAMRAGDERFIMSRLHPEVLKRYAEADCRELHSTADPTRRFVVRAVTQEPWDWVSDERTTPIKNAFAIDVEITSGGETRQTEIHIARIGSAFRFFSDCGVAN